MTSGMTNLEEILKEAEEYGEIPIKNEWTEAEEGIVLEDFINQ